MIRKGSLLTLTLVLGACASLPKDIGPFHEQSAFPAAESGALAGAAEFVTNSRGPDESGFRLLDKSSDALRWRLALIDSAVSSLDMLYYLWYADDSGRLLLHHVIEAADRGVKVRLVVDDLLLIGGDKGLVAIDRHPNIELRLFNPKWQRKVGIVIDFVRRFEQMNSRLHKKLIVADNHAVILGGRNIGDYYFGLSSKYNFHDLDVLGFGPVAREASDLFDNFWNSGWAVPADKLPAKVDEREIDDRRNRMNAQLQSAESLQDFSIEPRDWTAELEILLPTLHFGRSAIVYDRLENGQLVRGMVDPLGDMFRSAEQNISVVNAYIIPDQEFIDGMRELVDRGVAIQILSNSLASHDVPAVNSHYKKWRKPIIETGARLYELRSDPAIKQRVDTEPVVSKFIGLHTKAFVIDGSRTFIGSMNFDPRSADINTEMGVIIYSDSLASEMLRLAERDMAPENAWQVMLDDRGKLVWSNSDETVTRQPARSGWQRVMDVFFKILPKDQF